MEVISVQDKLIPIYDITGTKGTKELLSWMIDTIDYLEPHNKNYTKKQYYMIDDLKTIIHRMEVKEVQG